MPDENGSLGCSGLGSMLAIILVWQVHHSILWCILGAFLSWFYVVQVCPRIILNRIIGYR
ncbi:MAG: hypothetical protein LLG37_01670 [Spirochaetia bacterium]|nr:hypothetical protein [Spirochaetia bacterium]